MKTQNDWECDDLFQSNFLQYAAYVVRDRAIPDVDDGLKPVQRRLLTVLFRMNDGRYHKCANVVGRTMALHPHGDASIAGALYTIANKDFLIDKQGNFGSNLTGDPPAAARYTECRVSKLAERLLWNPDIIEFIPSYDGRDKEPLQLPAKVPLLLTTGTEGIAVGMSTKILPHNLIEVLEAEKKSLQSKKFEVYPDFPTGGLIDVSEYADGLGRVKVRAKLDTSDEKRVIIRELPFGSTTDSMLASLEKATKEKKLNVASVTDYTTDKCEIEVKLARGTYSKDVVDALYAYTECEKTIPVNMLVIQDDMPVEVTCTQVIKRHAKRLIALLNKELEIERDALVAKITWKKLEDIFITSGTYKFIEGKKTNEDVIKVVISGMKKLKAVVDDDIANKLIAIPIRRTSAYDSDKTAADIAELEKKLKDVETNLSDSKKYAAKWIDETIALIRKDTEYNGHRRTEIVKFDTVRIKDVATKDIEVKYDEEKGYAGTATSGAKILSLAKHDKVFIMRADASWTVLPLNDFGKVFVGKGAKIEEAIKDGINGRIFKVVYKKDDKAYYDEFQIFGWIMKKEYKPVKGEVLCSWEGDKDIIIVVENRGKSIEKTIKSKDLTKGRLDSHKILEVK
jgi:topoisomerase-4 subunit A